MPMLCMTGAVVLSGCGGGGGTTAPRQTPKTDFGSVSGVNLPWVNYGWDMGRNPWGGDHGGFSSEAGRARLDADLQFLAEHQVKLVRVFVFCDLRSGVLFDDDGVPVALDEYVAPDFGALVQTASGRGLRILPVLLDHMVADGVSHDPQGAALGEHPAVIREPAARAAFLNLLRPLVAQYAAHPAIYAWDVINEPELLTAVTQQEAQAFVGEVAQMIRREDSGARITVGCLGPAGPAQWAHTGINLHQFHHFAHQEAQFPFNTRVEQLGVQGPVLIGETEPGGNLIGKLETARRNGYAGLLFWSLNAEHGAEFRNQAAAYASWWAAP